MPWRSTTRDTSETLHERGTATVVSVVIAVHRPPARLPSGTGLPEWANTERPSQYIHESWPSNTRTPLFIFRTTHRRSYAALQPLAYRAALAAQRLSVR